MTTWFQLPAEIRTRIYEYAFTGLVLRPFSKTQFSAGDTHGKNGGEKQMQPYSIVPLTVCKRWNLEVTPYLLTAATFDFTAHPGDPPNIASPTAYELMRHVVILETHCFNTDWVSGVFGKMSQVQTMTIRKLRKVGVMKEGDFDGPDISQAFAEKVKVEPLQSLFCGYRFDHVYVKDTLKGSWPNRKILLEGYLWLDRVDAPHSVSEFGGDPSQTVCHLLTLGCSTFRLTLIRGWCRSRD